MAKAIAAAKVGLYFEMGGAYGFAHALYSRLTSLGYAAQVMFRPQGFVHAWVMLDGHNLDYRGVFRAAPGGKPLRDLAELERVAREYGLVYGKSYASDIASANRVLNDVFTSDLRLQPTLDA